MTSDFTTDMKGTIMFREINQAPQSVKKTFDTVEEVCKYASELISESKYVYIVGSGTSYHAGMVLQIRLLNRGIPAIAVKAPEFSDYLPETENTEVAAILISQSGESRDILDSLKAAKERAFLTVCITNTRESSLAAGSDISIITAAGDENALAATKTFVSAIAVVNLITEKLDSVYSGPDRTLVTDLESCLEKDTERIIGVAKTLKDKVVVLGNGSLHALALEGALKFKETSTMETEAYPIREYLHGPIQSLNRDTTVIVLHRPSENIGAVLEQLRKQTDSIIRIGFENEDEIMIRKVNDINIPAIFVVPLQLMANYKSVSLGLDPDHPQHLTKIVR